MFGKFEGASGDIANAMGVLPDGFKNRKGSPRLATEQAGFKVRTVEPLAKLQ
jgi:hypothetical protein